MAQLFINIIGHNASGKTYVAKKLAKKYDLDRVSGDDFRMFVYKHIPYFQSVNNSYPTSKNKQLNPLVIHYRMQLAWILMTAGQSIIFDGGGATQAFRAVYLDKIKVDFPNITPVIIWADLAEAELLKRLAKRDKISEARWVDIYHEVRKGMFEPPGRSEASVLLHYNQTNYQEIEREIGRLLV